MTKHHLTQSKVQCRQEIARRTLISQIAKVRNNDGLEEHIVTDAITAAGNAVMLADLTEHILSLPRNIDPFNKHTWTSFKVRIRDEGRRRVQNLPYWLGRALGIDTFVLRSYFPEHKVHPFISLCLIALDAVQHQMSLQTIGAGATADDASKALFLQIRLLARSPEFKTARKQHATAQAKREGSTTRYINRILAEYSRTLIVRVDLRYKNNRAQSTGMCFNDPGVTYVDACQHRAALTSDLKKKLYPLNLLGYLMRMEWAPGTGFHFHLMLMLNGNKVYKDLKVARSVGDHWEKVITGGLGLSFNVNAKASRGEYTSSGVGMVRRADQERRASVLLAATYLCKADYYVAYYKGERDQMFTRGQTPLARICTGGERRPLYKLVSLPYRTQVANDYIRPTSNVGDRLVRPPSECRYCEPCLARAI